MLPTRYLKRIAFRLVFVILLFWAGIVLFESLADKAENKDRAIEMKHESKVLLPVPPEDGKRNLEQKHANQLNQLNPIIGSDNDDNKLKRDIHDESLVNNRPVDLQANVIEQKVEEHDDKAIKEVNEVGANADSDIEANKDSEDEAEGKKENVDKKEDAEAEAQIAPPKDPEDSRKDSGGPGEMGKPVVIDRAKLTKEQQDDFDKGWQDNAFNRYASDMISLHRTLPDVRDPECKNLHYGNNLPDACVIIIFHNEAWSVLLRTVHSVIDRSDPKLLKEVILVDDFSDFDHLQQPLQDYVDKQDKVSLHRASERSGLIRARLMGFDRCTAKVAIFLDSHCEATEGWLPPLLSRISENETNVLVPVIDVISDDTFKYENHPTGSITSVYVGGFDWGLIFNWHPIPEVELKRINRKTTVPVRSPTMAGGLFAIDSGFFRKLGTYDSGFDIWGGENLELSFKTWMCGGTLETIPCSHVGHVFRKRSPYKWDTKRNALKRNLVRLAEVWLDDFKEYYYMRINHDLGDYGDVSDRKALRNRLQCKSFKWYLNNIFPELFVPAEALASGEIRNMDRAMCVDGNTDSDAGRKKGVIMFPCHGQGGNQFWLLSKVNEIRRDEYCLDTPDGTNLKIFNCHSQKGHQEFVYNKDDTIYNPTHDKCVEMSWDGKTVQLANCTGGIKQKWQIQRDPPKGPSKD